MAWSVFNKKTNSQNKEVKEIEQISQQLRQITKDCEKLFKDVSKFRKYVSKKAKQQILIGDVEEVINKIKEYRKLIDKLITQINTNNKKLQGNKQLYQDLARKDKKALNKLVNTINPELISVDEFLKNINDQIFIILEKDKEMTTEFYKRNPYFTSEIKSNKSNKSNQSNSQSKTKTKSQNGSKE